jgi:hypothetical protein
MKAKEDYLKLIKSNIENKGLLGHFKKNSKFHKQTISSLNKTNFQSSKLLKKIGFLTLKFYHMRKSLSENYLGNVFMHYKLILRAMSFKMLKRHCNRRKNIRMFKEVQRLDRLKTIFGGWKLRTDTHEAHRERNKVAKLYFMEKMINKWMAAFNKSKEQQQRQMCGVKLRAINLVLKGFLGLCQNCNFIEHVNFSIVGSHELVKMDKKVNNKKLFEFFPFYDIKNESS